MLGLLTPVVAGLSVTVAIAKGLFMPRRRRRWNRDLYPVFVDYRGCHGKFRTIFGNRWRLSYAAVFWSAAVTGAAVILGTPAAQAASTITYGLANYENDQNGYALTGSITTDGTIGTITAADIVAWQVTITSPFGPFSLPGYSDSGGPLSPFVLAQNSGTYLTTPGGLFEIASPTMAAANVLTLGDATGFIPITWSRNSTPEDVYSGMSTTVGRDLWISGGRPLELGTTVTWVIGSTSISPNGAVAAEPGSVVGLAMGMMGVGAVVTGRRWRRHPQLALLACRSCSASELATT